MISTRAKPTRRTSLPPHAGEKRRDLRHDPAGLSATLRDLALRSHRAVRAATTARADRGLTSDLDRELVELHSRIVQLQRSLHAQSLHGLTPYVSALRRGIEDQLALVLPE